MVSRHNRLRDVLLESCRLACLGPQVEAQSVLRHEGHRTRPTDILIPHWDLGKTSSSRSDCHIYAKFKYVNGGCDKVDLQLWQLRCASTVLMMPSAQS